MVLQLEKVVSGKEKDVQDKGNVFWLWYCSLKSWLTLGGRREVEVWGGGSSVSVRNMEILRVRCFPLQNRAGKYQVCSVLTDFLVLQDSSCLMGPPPWFLGCIIKQQISCPRQSPSGFLEVCWALKWWLQGLKISERLNFSTASKWRWHHDLSNWSVFDEDLLCTPAELGVYGQSVKGLTRWVCCLFVCFKSPFPISLCGYNKTLCCAHNLTRCFWGSYWCLKFARRGDL